MYNTSCKLVEFCRKEKYNNFQIYLIDSTQIPFIEDKNEMYTNSMDYWKVQDIHFCKKIEWIPRTEKPMTGDYLTYNNFCIAGWVVSLIAILGTPIYFILKEIERKKRQETQAR